jgi:hypothetical protein
MSDIYILRLALSFDGFIAFSANTDLLAIFQDLHLNPDGVEAVVAHQLYVGKVNGSLGFNDPALGIFEVGLLVTLHLVDAFHNNPIFLPDDFEDFADLASVLSGKNLDFIISSDMRFFTVHNLSPK